MIQPRAEIPTTTTITVLSMNLTESLPIAELLEEAGTCAADL
jgi:hypothetical protein